MYGESRQILQGNRRIILKEIAPFYQEFLDGFTLNSNQAVLINLCIRKRIDEIIQHGSCCQSKHICVVDQSVTMLHNQYLGGLHLQVLHLEHSLAEIRRIYLSLHRTGKEQEDN